MGSSHIYGQEYSIGPGWESDLYSVKDTARIDEWLDISSSYRYSNIDSSMYFAKYALIVATEINYREGQRKANYIIGLNYSSKYQSDSAIVFFEKSTTISKELNDSLWLSMSLQAAGRDYRIIGRYKQAFENYFESLKLRVALGDSSRLSWPLNNIASLYFYQENYDKALEYYKHTLEIEKIYSAPVEQASTYGNVGLAYMSMENYSEALFYLKKSYHMLDSLGEKCRLIYPILSLGTSCMELSQLKEANNYFEMAYRNAKECENPTGISTALFGIGLIQQKKGFFNEAEKSFLASYELAKKYEMKSSELDAAESLYELYKAKQDFRNAFEFLEIARELKDELFNQDLTEQLTTTELNYEFELERDSLEFQKKTELLVVNAKLNQQRLVKMIVIGGLFVSVILVFVIYRNYRLKRTANINLERKNEIQNEKLKIEESIRRQLEIENNQKARSLTATSIQLLNFNEKLSEVVNQVKRDITLPKDQQLKMIKELDRLRDDNNHWNNIKIHFENVHPDFFKRLEDSFPALSSNDHKLLTFLKMKLSNKEIALVLNVTTRAVEQSKRRLKKKLKMDSQDMDILSYISLHSANKKALA